MDTVLTLACSLWFNVRKHTLLSLLFVRSCLRDDQDMGAQLVPVLVVVLLLLVLQILLQSSCAGLQLRSGCTHSARQTGREQVQ